MNDVRCFALVYCAILKFAKKPLVLLLLLVSCPAFSQSPSSNEDLKKQAGKLFEEEDYPGAYKLYSQLVSNFPKDPVYNFRLGVCMIYAEPDKKKCMPYLKFAAGNAENNKELRDVLFYLGKACHINYLFDEAIRHYNDYKLTAPASQIKKLQVDREILACTNGKRLLSSLTDLEVMTKAQLPENDYFRNYKKIGGKLLVKPDEFRTSADKKKKEKSVIFLPAGSNVVYFSSYGESPENGRDIYTAARLPNGTYSKPEKVKGINTEYDEDYPFLHPDGKTLYFASKGYNSMGGYDIFKSTFNEATNSWSPPVNLEFPVNSPDDDFLYVTDSLETIAYFSTGRQSPPGKVDVLKVKTRRRPIDIIAMKGSVIPGSPEYTLKSSINVKDIFTQNEIATVETAEDGSYQIELPNGGKFLFTVQTPGVETQSAQVSLPVASAAKPFRQTISYEKGKLKILNYFDEPGNDNSYLQYLKVIEKKARLDVNEGEAASTPLAAATTNPSPAEPPKATTTAPPETKTKPRAAETSSSASVPDPKKGMDNKQLAKLARQDAEESRQEAVQLNRDYLAAKESGQKQKEEADKKSVEASDALFKAETLTDEAEKRSALEKAGALKASAENEQAAAAKILQLASKLDDDAKIRQKEADLNMEYAKELEKSGGKGSMARLDNLQKQISELAGKKNESENLMSEMKTEIEEKERQISDVEQATATIRGNLDEIKTAITEREAELNKTRKKAAKKELGMEIDELRKEEAEKVKQISSREEEIKILNSELAVIKNQHDIAARITAEDVRPDEIVSQPAQNQTAKDLQEKYKRKVVISDPDSRSSIEESTMQLNSYNKELDQLLGKTKNELNRTKNKDSRAKLGNEIRQAEAAKKQNQQQIAANNKKLLDLNQATAKAPDAARSTFDPISATSGSEAISKLDNLSSQLNGNDNENFDYNGYQNPKAQSLKVEADARINDAIARQKKLKDEIAASRQDIGQSSSSGSTQQLNKEAEDLLAQSQKLKQDAKAKSGAEKDRLMSESKNLEDQANLKYIDAAEITRSDNAAVMSANQENIQSLIDAGKAGEADLALAKSLNEEARAESRKAADIRIEGNSLGNVGGKLGSFSNAEEKEAEAILKQQQAIEILKKSNPGLSLKTPVTSTSNPSGTGNSADLGAKLQTVNAGLNDLAAIKIDSYQKLNEANDAEISQLMSDISANQQIVDNTPSFKTDLIAGTKKVENARSLKQNADASSNPNEKLNNLVASIKKQNEAIRQLSSLSAALAQQAATTPVVKNDPPAETPSVPASQEPVTIPAEPPVQTAPTPSETVTPAVARTEEPVNELSMLSEIDLEKPAATQPADKDTTTGQMISYFDNSSPSLNNPQASASVAASLSHLKDLEAEESNIEDALGKVGAAPLPGPSEIKELNGKADLLMGEAEELQDDAQDFKKQAQDKSGEEKDYILAQARDLEIQAQDKMIQASEFRQQANESEYKTNTNAITELMEKLKVDNPGLAAELQAKREEYAPLKVQINNLRTEANALSNKAAKTGAISNAEEKEQELIQKQNAVLEQLKKQYPNYNPGSTLTPAEQTAELHRKKAQLREKQYTELTNLTNAFSLEYESSKNNIPSNLNAQQKIILKTAEDLNMESKRLLIRSAQEKNEKEKIKLLTRAAKSGNTAITNLNKLSSRPAAAPKDELNELSEIGNRIISSNTEEPPAVVPVIVRPSPSHSTPKNSIKIEGLEVVEGNAYSASHPILIDAPMESGLVFRVQIGAFKTRLPNNAFKGLSPLNGETTNSGYIRYTAGNFYKIETANAVKNDLRNLGYSDAFVVVYFNGRRITLAEALDQMNKEGKSVDPNAPQTAGITSNANVPKAAVNTAIQESVTVTRELEQINGLLYTIQIGVYTKQISKPQILSLRPIFREQLTNGLYRYTAGIYNNPEKLLLDKARVVDMGIRDAFVSAYINGKRVPFAEARERQANDPSLKPEQENPIIFPERNEAPAASAPNPFEQLMNTSVAIEPFKNDVKEYPESTAENGVKSTEEGVTYKVQIGAFSKQVPDDVAARFSAIKNWPIDNKQINGLFIYNIGNFSEARFAKELKEEAIRLGITDAFVTVYRDGKKLYGPEAENLLR